MGNVLTNKYRERETWIGSKWRHERLIAEGMSTTGRRWAVLKQWNDQFLGMDERETFIMRVDLSEWWTTYQKYFYKLYQQPVFVKKLPLRSDPTLIISGNFCNRSPGWWDNGFCTNMCFAMTLVRYESCADRLERAAMGHIDIEDLDMKDVADDICTAIQPAIDFFDTVGTPSIPGDDF